MIVVTGGAGFIGSNLVKGLNDAGEENIVVVDNLSNAEKHLNLNRLRFRDYLDKQEFIDQLDSFRGIDAIFHQGACSSTTESDGRYMMANNYQYSKTLLQHSLEHGIDFLYASSAAVYGDGLRGFIEESACEYPLNVYGFSKFAFDNYVRRQFPKASSQVLGLRYFNVYGPRENHKGRMASVAFHLFNQLHDKGTMRLFEGSEGFRRDFIHVRDTVKINLHFFQSKTSGIFNAGTGQARSFQEIADTLQHLHEGGRPDSPNRGQDARAPRSFLEYISFPDDLRGKYQEYTEANTDNLRNAGYAEDFLTLEEGLRLYYEQLSASRGFHD